MTTTTVPALFEAAPTVAALLAVASPETHTRFLEFFAANIAPD